MLKKKRISFYISIVLSLIFSALIILKLLELRNDRFLNKQKSEQVERILTEGEQLIVGSYDAPNSLLVYYSYECKYCRHFFFNIYPEIYDAFVKNNRINIILKPINLTENEAMTKAYNLLYCLNRLGLFEELHQILLNHHKAVTDQEIMVFQNNLTMENDEIAECLMIQERQPQYLKNNKELSLLHRNEVPVFIINKRIFKGKITTDEIKKAIK